MRDKPTYQKLNPQVQEIEKNQSNFSTQLDREAHLKNVLLAIRDVNQLIARETDPEQLIRKICTSLVKTRGYFNAWIALTDEKCEFVESSAASGFNGGFYIMESALHRGDFPLCMYLSLGKDELSVTRNPPADCPDCPLASEYEGRAGLTCRLSYKDRVFGIISVSVPEKFAHDSEEQDLFAELAADLGFALSKLKTDVQAHRLHQIVTSIPQPISLVSDDYRYLAVNDVYAELFGTVAVNIVGKTPADFFGEQFFEKEIKPRLDHVLGGSELQYEIQADFPGRGNRWMYMSYYPYRSEQGNIAGVISHGHDITERKQAEIALQESEVYYRTLFENVNDAVLVHEIGFDGKPGKFIAANSVALKRLGYTHDELLKLTPKDITTEKGYKDLSEARANVISNCAAIFETTHLARNGSPIPVESHVSIMEIAGQRVAVSVVRDLSERKRAEDVLRKSEWFYRSTLDGLLSHIAVLDDRGEIILTNKAYRDFGKHNGVKPSAVAEGANYLSVCDTASGVYSEEANHFAEGIRQVLLGKSRSFEMEYPCHSPDEKRWFIGRVTPFDGEGPKRVVVTHENITERKQAEEVLAHQRKTYEQILDHSLAGYWDWDIPTGDEYLSPTFKKMFGYEDHEIENSAESWQKLIFAEDLPGVYEKFNQHIESKGEIPFYNELRYHHKNGSTVWVICTGKVIEWDDDGKAKRMIGCHIDITERKQAEEALHRERERLASIIEGTNVGTWEWNVQTGETIFNERWAEIIGYSLKEISPLSIDTWMKFTHPDDLKNSGELLQRHFSGKLDYYECEARMRHKNGEWVWVLDRGKVAVWTEDGKPLHIMGTHQDITERKKDVIALRENRQLLQNMLEAIPDMVSVHDSDMTILYSNWNGFGSVPEEKRIIGTKCYHTYRGYNEICPDCQAKTVLQTNRNFQTEARLPDGRWVDLRVIPICGSQKDTALFLEWVRDITHRKQAETEQEKLQAQLLQAQKMESVGRLAGGVAHDFNNMLGVILGHTELALLKAEEDNDLISDLKEIQNAAKRSADITKQLLAFARKQIISPRRIELNDTVESMLNMLRRLIGEDIDLVWKPSAHLWPVKMDPSQIDQILANLCVNARDAIDGVGKLTIETGIKTFDEEYCNEHLGFIPGDFVLLAVSDNGCGMDKDTLENLFEPFFTTKEVGKGTGLGLATIYGIIKQNNGFINVYSEPGQGSTFRIYLSRLVADEDTDKAIPEKKAAAGGSETILLVEDEPMILDMTTTMLEMSGYTVLAAASPDEAIRLAKDHTGKIHLLMSDVVMPEMNGRDLAGQITALYPGIRLLFMSGYTANVIAHHGVLDDGVAFIQKPFSMADMTEMVREVLDMAPDKN